MKSISIKDLKKDLASYAEAAAGGESVLVTKHNKPYIRLTGIAEPTVRLGTQHGKGHLVPCLKKNKTRGKYLKFLLDDRDDDA